MSDTSEFIARSMLIGVGATITMDVWATILRGFGIPSLDFALVGRWIANIPRGRWHHESIARTAPVRGERLMGWCTHYAIGITFATLLLAVFGLDWARTPKLVPALIVGVATVVGPWFVLQPALGAGIASSKTRTPIFNSLKSLVTHTVFGVGLFVAARATVLIVSTGQ
ncbi:MAG: DUF2938 domain-containing protein [Polyangiaceae bacterium]